VCVSVCARVRRAVAALFVVVCVSTGPSILNRDSERAGWRCGVGRRVLLQHTALVGPPVRPRAASQCRVPQPPPPRRPHSAPLAQGRARP